MSGNRDATDQEALDGVRRIDELFKRSETARQRQRLNTRLRWATTIISVVAIIVALLLKVGYDKRQANIEVELAQSRANEKLQEELADQRNRDLQRYIAQTSALIRENELLKAMQTTPAATTPAPTEPTARAEQSEVTASVRKSLQQAIAPAAGASPGPAAASAAASQSCKGAIWIGANNLVNLRFAGPDAGRRVTLADIQPDRRFISTRSVFLRLGLPGENYKQQEAIGTVPEGAQIVALRPPTIVDRSGKQYWLEVGVSGQVCSLVYFQFTGGPADNARGLKEALEKQGYLVPGQEQVSSARGLAEVRYYYVDDRATAEQLARDAMADAKALNLAAGRHITARDFTTRPDPQKPLRGTLELWLDLSKS
jgi:hypothetical protein